MNDWANQHLYYKGDFKITLLGVFTIYLLDFCPCMKSQKEICLNKYLGYFGLRSWWRGEWGIRTWVLSIPDLGSQGGEVITSENLFSRFPSLWKLGFCIRKPPNNNILVPQWKIGKCKCCINDRSFSFSNFVFLDLNS